MLCFLTEFILVDDHLSHSNHTNVRANTACCKSSPAASPVLKLSSMHCCIFCFCTLSPLFSRSFWCVSFIWVKDLHKKHSCGAPTPFCSGEHPTLACTAFVVSYLKGSNLQKFITYSQVVHVVLQLQCLWYNSACSDILPINYCTGGKMLNRMMIIYLDLRFAL